MSNSSKSGAHADNSTVATHSLSNANIDNDDYSTVKNMNVHVSGDIEEVAPRDDDDDDSMNPKSEGHTLKDKASDAYATAKSKAADLSETVKNKASELGQSASEGWEAAKIKGANAYETVKQEANEYTSGKESTKSKDAESDRDSKMKKSKSLSGDKSALKETVDDHVEDIRAEGDRDKPQQKKMTQKATEYAMAARDKASSLAQQAHDKIQDQTGSDLPLREQAQIKASEWATKIEAAAGQAKDKVYKYAGYGQDKGSEEEKSTESSDSSTTKVSDTLKQTAKEVKDSAIKGKDAVKQGLSNATTSKEDNNLSDQSKQNSSPSILSQASAVVSNGLSSAAQMLGLRSSDKTTTTSIYESTERVVDKDEESGTATVAKTEKWTEQKDSEPAKSRSKESQFQTTI